MWKRSKIVQVEFVIKYTSLTQKMLNTLKQSEILTLKYQLNKKFQQELVKPLCSRSGSIKSSAINRVSRLQNNCLSWILRRRI